MADTFKNPYNYTSPIGAALADLTRTIISGPSRAEKIAAAENMLKIKRANENLLKAQTIISTPGYDQNAFAAAAKNQLTGLKSYGTGNLEQFVRGHSDKDSR